MPIIKHGLSTLVVILFFLQVSAQNRIVEGNVVDANTGDPLPFATIGIKGTTTGTATNSEGRFIISIKEEVVDSMFFCSYMGYKDFQVKAKRVHEKLEIKLELDTFTLDEVEIRPWEPWDYIWNAMQKIPENYPNRPYMTEGYYSEFMAENDVFLKFTEGVVEIYNPAYGVDEKSQSKVLKARRRDDLGTLQFMRQKLEKKYEKEKKKAEKKGEEWESKGSIDEEIISASFGGPEEVLNADPLRDTASFLDIRQKKKYKYFIEGYSRYYGEQVIVIGFKSKGKYEHQKQAGKIYISLESDAIMSIEYDSKVIIPAVARPILFVMGYGITNPELTATMHYKPIGGQWYLNDFSVEGGAMLTRKKMFKKNEKSQFDISMALINNRIDIEKANEIPEEERIDKDKPLEEQVEPDPAFWNTYSVVRPTRLGN